MANYVCTEYATQALLDAAIIALDTTSTHEVIPYKHMGKLKFMLVTPSPGL
jgi:hypothetical protein